MLKQKVYLLPENLAKLSDLSLVFVLKLNESVALAPLKSTILPSLFTAGISIQYCHKLPDVFE